MTGIEVDKDTDFGRLLVEARDVAMGRTPIALSGGVDERVLNGEPYRAFRSSVEVHRRREEGTFFSSSELADELAQLLRARMPADAIVLDPTCGMGDLLLAYAKLLPIEKSFSETLTRWGAQLAGIERRHDLVLMTKARLVALLRRRGGFVDPLYDLDQAFPQIVAGDMFFEQGRIRSANGLLVNPPFGQTSDYSSIAWGTGQQNAAALFLDAIVRQRSADAIIVAVLPEVLRCGARYSRFRAYLSSLGLGGPAVSRGAFDPWTNVDVFVTVLEPRDAILWQVQSTVNVDIGDRFTVRIGSVVPHRDKELGRQQPFICAKSVPRWSDGFVPEVYRGYTATTFTPPFVVIRRTSSPRDGQRAVGAIIIGANPVLVENHLICLEPKDGLFQSCADLLKMLKQPSTTAHLNNTIRCRHLTTGSVRTIPWIDSHE